MSAIRSRRVEIARRPSRVEYREQQLQRALDEIERLRVALDESQSREAHLVGALKDQWCLFAWRLRDAGVEP